MRKRSDSQSVKRRRIVAFTAEPRGTATESPACETLPCSPDDSVLLHPHRLEQDVRYRLMSDPRLNFTSLVVRRLDDGVCLEGVLETEDDSTDVEHLVRRVAGVNQVLNNLVVRRNRQLPLKG